MAKAPSQRLAILGAGPIGLEAALYARSLGFEVMVYERGQIAEALRHWGHVKLFTPFGLLHTPLGRQAILAANSEHKLPGTDDCITGWQFRETYLEPLAKCELLKGCVRTGIEVASVGRPGWLKEEGFDDPARGQSPFRLLLRDDKQKESAAAADLVLDCSGTYGRHRWLGTGGMPAPGERPARNLIAYGLDDVLGSRKQAYSGKGILVVGGGYSAATTVANLSSLTHHYPEMWIIWLVRGAGTSPIKRIPNDPFKERDRLAVTANNLATRTDGNVEFHQQAHVELIELVTDHSVRVTARIAGQTRSWEVDRVVGNVGFSPDSDIYRELHVRECPLTLGMLNLADALRQSPPGPGASPPAIPADVLRTPEPGFFVLGSKSYGRFSGFFLSHGHAQIRAVFALITGKRDLDLYKKPGK